MSGASSPARTRSSVVLPAPLGPTRPIRCPARTSNRTPWKTGSPEYCRPRSVAVARIMGPGLPSDSGGRPGRRPVFLILSFGPRFIPPDCGPVLHEEAGAGYPDVEVAGPDVVGGVVELHADLREGRGPRLPRALVDALDVQVGEGAGARVPQAAEDLAGAGRPAAVDGERPPAEVGEPQGQLATEI